MNTEDVGRLARFIMSKPIDPQDGDLERAALLRIMADEVHRLRTGVMLLRDTIDHQTTGQRLVDEADRWLDAILRSLTGILSGRGEYGVITMVQMEDNPLTEVRGKKEQGDA